MFEQVEFPHPNQYSYNKLLEESRGYFGFCSKMMSMDAEALDEHFAGMIADREADLREAIIRLVKVTLRLLKADVARRGWTSENKKLVNHLEWATSRWPMVREADAMDKSLKRLLGNFKKESKWINSFWAWLLGDA